MFCQIPSRRASWSFGIALAVSLAWPLNAALAQFGAGGVAVDADGVLRVRKTGGGARMKNLREARKNAPPGKVYISLPKLFDAVRKAAETGDKLPDNIRFLDGMVKLENIFVYPEDKDLVIVGQCEPFEISDPYRPVGDITGRPVLQLDDLVVALRIVGPAGNETTFGCSLDLPEGGIERMQAVSGRLGAVRQGNFAGPGRKMAAAVGPQQVRIFGVPNDTRFALVCLEADYLMKRLALGLDKSPIPAVKSYLALMQPGEGIYNRQWFKPEYEPLVVAIDGLGYEIRGQGLKVAVSASDRADDENTASPGARKFAEAMSANFVELAKFTPSYSDLWNLVDLAVLAALIRTDGLDKKAGWDCKWLSDPRNYRVAKVAVPKTAETLVNYRKTGNVVNFAVGGVNVDPSGIVDVERRKKDEAGHLTSLSKRRVKVGWSEKVSSN